MKRNTKSAICACGKFIHAKDEQELVARLERHFRNCNSQPKQTEGQEATA